MPSVLSLFISRWDVAVARPGARRDQEHARVAVGKADLCGLAGAARLASAGRGSPRKGARLQRLLFASTGTKDPEASDTLYIEAFAAPDTINTMPDKTLLAFADHGKVGEPLPADGGDAEQVFQAHRDADADVDGLGLQLQQEGAEKFVDSWNELLKTIESESERLAA